MITVVGMKAGKKDFGVSPDKGELYLTLRAQSDDDLQEMKDLIDAEAKRLSDMSALSYKISFTEEFPAVLNDAGIVKKIKCLTAKKHVLTDPFPWSEDFGWYSGISKICFFGIGSGIKHPHLHSPEYDFNDDIIQPASEFLYKIYLSGRING